MSGQFHAPVALIGERAPDTHRIGGWVGPRTSLNAVTKKEIPAFARNRNLVVQTVNYTEWNKVFILQILP